MMVTAERLHELFWYRKTTGLFIRRTTTGYQGRYQAGTIAGSLNKALGYVQIRIDGKLYFAHRLAWLYVTGVFPPVDIDHRNEVKHDNRWRNLRAATRAENTQNVKAPRSNNRSGFRGVYARRGGFAAEIKVGDVKIYLGDFKTAKAAHQAHLDAKRTYHPFAAR